MVLIPTGDTPCILTDSKDHYVVFDAGNGIYKLDKYIKEDKPISLFISHFHLDHVSGLHTFGKFKFKQGIDVYVGQNRTNDFKTLYHKPYMIGFGNKNLDVRLHELSETNEDKPFPMQAIKQVHLFDDHGFRVKLEDKTIAYTGDCRLTDAARKLAKDADILISECANKQFEKKTHMNPMEAATLAKEQNVKKLLLTHFSPDVYPSLEDRIWAEDAARKIFPKTIAAQDEMIFKI